jgi:flagellar protein FlaG
MDIRSVGNYTQGTAPQAARPAQPDTPAPPVAPAAAASNGNAVSAQEQLAKAVEELNKAVKDVAPGIEFSIDADLHQTVVKIVDQNTKEVLRQMPTEETIAIAKSLDKLQGLLIQNQA